MSEPEQLDEKLQKCLDRWGPHHTKAILKSTLKWHRLHDNAERVRKFRRHKMWLRAAAKQARKTTKLIRRAHAEAAKNTGA